MRHATVINLNSGIRQAKDISYIQQSKFVDPLLIPAWALKDAREHVAEPLCFLFNQFLTEQRFPNNFKRAHVLPSFKKDDTEDPITYRPILLTGDLAKIFEIHLLD